MTGQLSTTRGKLQAGLAAGRFPTNPPDPCATPAPTPIPWESRADVVIIGVGQRLTARQNFGAGFLVSLSCGNWRGSGVGSETRHIECHTLPALCRCNTEDWPNIVKIMSHRASLNAAEREGIV